MHSTDVGLPPTLTGCRLGAMARNGLRRRAAAYLGIACLLWLAHGCGDDESPAPAAACTELGGECIGVPAGDVCGQTYCTGDASCSDVTEVSSNDALASAAGSAGAGSCIALAPGNYSGVSLPGGVSLLGKGAGSVKVGAVVLGDGSGALVRGIELTEGITLNGARDARIEAARIRGASDAVQLQSGASVTVSQCEIATPGLHGIAAYDAASVNVSNTLIDAPTGPGVWVQCTGGCECATKTAVDIDHVLIDGAHHMGIHLAGAVGTMSNVTVQNTEQIRTPVQLAGGGGLAISGCSDIDATGLTVDGAESFGVLVDDSSADLGAPGEEQGIIIVDVKVGLWAGNIGASDTTQLLNVTNAEVVGNRAVGLGIGAGAQGIIIVDVRVADTLSEALLVEPASSGQQSELGHGIVWKEGATAELTSVTLSNNSMQSLLIDGPVGAGSRLEAVTLEGGDEQKGIIQQSVMADDTSPEIAAGAPDVSRETAAVADVPVGIAAPSAI